MLSLLKTFSKSHLAHSNKFNRLAAIDKKNSFSQPGQFFQPSRGNSQLLSSAHQKMSSSTLCDHDIVRKWWKELVVYQVYPRSFQDSNGDGIGDLVGMTSRLDYLKELGVDAIWLSPVYKSPNDDNGYDISDYKAIMEEFGTFEDWKRMKDEVHKRGMKIVMDLVLNHTSDEHPWFQESRKSKHNNPYRDYYYWRPAKEGGKEPNNWISFFGGSAWEWDEATGEYYLHLFSKKQPDLNWENPQVRKELHDMVAWWCEQGVDGFRMDVINVISKEPGMPDAPIKNEGDMYHWAGEHFYNGPKFVEWMREMKQDVFDKYPVYTVGETPNVTPEHAREFTEETNGVLNMLFHFELMEVDVVPGEPKWECQPWKLKDIKDITSKWQLGLNCVGWNSIYLENHDQPRSVSRFGDDSTEENRVKSAKRLATWELGQKGTPYIYQGQELGMTNVKFPSIDDYRDLETLNFWKTHKERGDKTEEEMLNAIWQKSRDNNRTPMQWSGLPNAGFCPPEVKPWIGVNSNYTHINVEQALADKDSIWHYYKRLIQLRKRHLVLVYGIYSELLEDHPQVHAYLRSLETEQLLVIANFSNEPATICFSEQDRQQMRSDPDNATLLIGNYPDSDSRPLTILQPHEARMILLATDSTSNS
jgi:oligo-1,6-glucosidase